jgi:tetratricopeptide (TPR) repeat protein
LIGLVAVSSIARADKLDLELARHLIVEGKAEEAYKILEPFELKQAGNSKFDYLLGLSALNSGQADKASIIFERVLAVDPFHAAARVDLGRAYFQLGDFVRARTELTLAQSLNPPPTAQATINLYLQKISESEQVSVAETKLSTQLGGYLEGGAGYNTNVNNSTSESQIVVPILVNTQLALSSANIKTGDGYLGFATGGEFIHSVSSAWSLYGGVDLRSRNDLKYHNFDILAVDGNLGASYSQNAEQFKGGVVAGQFNLGGIPNHKSDGLNAQWTHTYNAANQSVLFSQFLRYRFPDAALATNNFNQTILGLGWLHATANGRTSFSGSLFGGNEHDTNFRIDGGKTIQGIRLSGESMLRDNLELFVSGGIQSGKYDLTNSSFLVVRDDKQIDINMGLNYRYGTGWIIRPQFSLIQNHSNIIIDEYNQADISLTLRREFN